MKIDGFTVNAIHRKRSERARYDSGGLAIYVRNEIKESFKFLPATSSQYAWVKLEKNAFNMSKDMFICFLLY